MRIRDTINENPWIGRAAVGMVILIALLVTVSMFGGEPVVRGPAQAYFSTDDGRTWFADDASKIPPFEHNGQTAYLAGVHQFEGTEPFVAYLIRYTPEGKAELERFLASVRNSSDPRVNEIKLRTREIKRPGEQTWTPSDSLQFDEIMVPSRPTTIIAQNHTLSELD